MKNRKDMKKLALMGMAAGMLLSIDNAEASFGSDQINNTENESYLAAGCGSKCGGHVASRQRSSNYYYQSCNASQQNNGCNSYMQHGCNTQGYYNPSEWSTNQGQQHSCNSFAGNQNQQQQSQPDHTQQLNSQGQNNAKYQASNGCGGPHGCHGSPATGTNNSNKYQASNGCHGTSQSTTNANGSNYYNPSQVAEADKHATPPTLNEADLQSKLNAQGKSTYNSLTPEGKKLALQLANAECKGKNDCKGLNSCKTDKNECAGKGGCKAQSKCSFKDKNLAVKVAAAKMAEKRNGLQNKQ
jgi:hypothetical protein